MNKFLAIFNRTLKEATVKNRRELMSDISNIEITQDMLNSEDIVDFIYIHCDNNYALDQIEQFSNARMNQIFLLYTAKYIISFLKENNIYDVFEYNLNKASDLKGYFEYLFNCGYSPFIFIIYAFTWARTKEGQAFWDNIHKKYKQYLINNLLFNEKKY